MDNEVSGSGIQYDYGFRIYNPRIGKFLSVDPLAKDYPWYTPYQFAGNMPIWAIDLDGLESVAPMKPGENKNGVFTTAVDNTRAGYTEEYLSNRNNSAPSNGQIRQFEPNIAEKVSDYLNSPSSNYGLCAAKFTGRIVYETLDDGWQLATGLLLGPEYARKMSGEGINAPKYLNAGISTSLNFVPWNRFSKVGTKPSKIMNASEYSKAYKGTNVLKVSPLQRGNQILFHNYTVADNRNMAKTAELSVDILSSYIPELRLEVPDNVDSSLNNPWQDDENQKLNPR